MVPRSLVRPSALLLLGSMLAAPSCTPATPPADVPAVPVRAAPPPEPVAPLTYEPVQEPGNLAGVLRIGSPVRDLVMWRDLLPAHTPFGQLAALGPAGLADLTFGSLGEFVELSAPVDMAVLEEDSVLVGSVELRDFGQARAAARADFEFRERADGSFSVAPRPDAKAAGLVGKFKLACGVYPGGEPVRSHLVCSANAKALASAAPYLARTVSRKAAAPGIRYEMPESAMRRLLDSREKAADAKVDDDPAAEAGRQVGMRWMKDLSADFESMAIDLSAGAGGVSVGMDLRFRSVKSSLALVAVGSRGGAVPAAFWSIPGDADLALYLPGALPDALRASLGSFWNDVADAMPDEEVPRQAWRDFVAQASKLVLTGGPLMFAHGSAPASADAGGQGSGPSKPGASAKGAGPAKAAGARAQDPVKAHKEARKKAAGWALVGVSEPLSKWTDGLREMIRISNTTKKSTSTGGAAAGAGKGASTGAGAKPGGTASPSKHTSSRTLSSTKEVPVRASEGLPAGTLHLVRQETVNPAYVPPPEGPPAADAPHDEHVFVVGNAETTWIIVSENEALARAKAQEVIKGTGSIQARPDLAPLRSLPAGGIGFGTLRGVLALMGDRDTADELSHTESLLAAARTLPNAGATPLFVSLASTPNDRGEGATLRISASISIAAALDLIQWFQ